MVHDGKIGLLVKGGKTEGQAKPVSQGQLLRNSLLRVNLALSCIVGHRLGHQVAAVGRGVDEYIDRALLQAAIQERLQRTVVNLTLPEGEIIAGENDELQIDVTIIPNPFVTATSIQFTANQDIEDLTIEVYNMMGVKVADLYKGSVSAEALNKVSFTARPSDAQGMYLVVLRAENGTVVKRMILIR